MDAAEERFPTSSGLELRFGAASSRRSLTPFSEESPRAVGLASQAPKNHSAMAVGGGIDFTVSNHIYVRPGQAEYFMMKIPDGLNNRQNNFRSSTGIALWLGK
jgi:hypothetical protein